MSLIGFHKVLISTAIVFCLFFSGWQVGQYLSRGQNEALILASFFFLLFILLVFYFINLKRILGRKTDVSEP